MVLQKFLVKAHTSAVEGSMEALVFIFSGIEGFIASLDFRGHFQNCLVQHVDLIFEDDRLRVILPCEAYPHINGNYENEE